MNRLRWLAALLLRGRDAEFVKHDLDELYARNRLRGMSSWRAHWRYLHHLVDSTLSAWRADRPWAPAEEWIGDLRRGTLLQDVRFGLRLLRKHPTSAGIAIGGLALAMAVTTTVFTIVDATMLRPYAMDDPSSVMTAIDSNHRWPYWPYAHVRRMQSEATLSRVEASLPDKVRFSTTQASDGDRRRILFVTGGYLSMLGGRPFLGRPLVSSDDAVGADPVIVVSHQFWSAALNADPSAIGRTLWLNGSAVTLVGVLLPEFTGPINADIRPALWAPLSALHGVLGGRPLDDTSRTTVEVVVRVAPGVAPAVAQEELATIVGRAARPGAAPSSHAARRLRLAPAASPLDGSDLESYLALAFFFGTVGLVLAVACANTANLLLAAATTRMTEMGVRLAMGASSARLINQLLNESLLLGTIAGALGLILSIWFVPILRGMLDLPLEVAAGPDARAVFFTTAVALVCGLATGLSPARYGARGDVLAALRSQTSGASSRGPSRLRTSFVGFQAAVSIFLLVAALLLVRSAIHFTQTEVGFDVDRLLAVGVQRQPAGVDVAAHTRRVLMAVSETPSVESASLSQYQPFGSFLEHDQFTHGGKAYQVNVNRTDADFFSTTGLRIVRGREYTSEEVAKEAPVALISASLAAAFFQGSDPIGQSIASMPSEDGGRQEHATIIGVVADALLSPLWSEASGAVFRPISRVSSNPPNVIIRTTNPGVTARAVEDALKRVDPLVPPAVSVVRDGLDRFFGSKRMFAALSVPAAVLVLLLAAFGMFGVTAFAVSQRAPEVSLRMALGASSSDLLRMLARDSLRPVLVGLVVGLAAALLASRASARMIGGISPHDPLAIGGAALTLLACASMAIVLPARRAAKGDPASVLRQM